MQKICIIIAMQAEAKPLIERYGLQNIEGFFGTAPTELYQGIIAGKELNVVTLGKQHGYDLVGCESAAMATTLAINALHPDMIVNAGTCGAFKAYGAEVGDVYLGEGSVIFHDRHVDNDPYGVQSIGNYPLYNSKQIAADLGLKLGRCSTGSSFDLDDKDFEVLKREGGQLIDMEAGAIAFVASVFKTPLICIKCVSNIIDTGKDKSENSFSDNMKNVCKTLGDACTKLIQYIFVDQPTLFY